MEFWVRNRRRVTVKARVRIMLSFRTKVRVRGRIKESHGKCKAKFQVISNDKA